MQSERNDIETAVERFTSWLDSYGETSYDHQSYFAGPFGGWAKRLYYQRPLVGIVAVSPMIFSEALVPSARRLFWKRQRLPIADAHYAMGFASLAGKTGDKNHYRKAVHFLEVLQETRCSGDRNRGWGYPFDWVTRNGIIPRGTSLITTTPYVFEAFKSVYEIDKSEKWLAVLRSLAEHVAYEYPDVEFSQGAKTCGYTPFDDTGGVINASAYRAFTLMSASQLFADDRYRKIADGNLNFVLAMQQPNGSWLYAADSVRDFVDHFHTCFVMKALAKIEKLTGHAGCREAIDKGVAYYLENLFDERGLPKPFAKAPRLTVYKNELYDYAECINLCVLLQGKYPKLDEVRERVLADLLTRWQKRDGSFRSRKLYIGWDNVPMHRWAQSQILRSLCLVLYDGMKHTSSVLQGS